MNSLLHSLRALASSLCLSVGLEHLAVRLDPLSATPLAGDANPGTTYCIPCNFSVAGASDGGATYCIPCNFPARA